VSQDDFWQEPEAEIEIPENGWRTCGWCGEQFWWESGGVSVTGAPMCLACDRRLGQALRERTARWRAKQAAKKAVLADTTGLADALLAGSPSKRGDSKAKKR